MLQHCPAQPHYGVITGGDFKKKIQALMMVTFKTAINDFPYKCITAINHVFMCASSLVLKRLTDNNGSKTSNVGLGTSLKSPNIS